MSQKTISIAIAAAAMAVTLGATLGLGLPATAAPLSGGESLRAQAPAVVTEVRTERRARKSRKVVRRHAVPRDAYGYREVSGSRDTVGSIGYDGYGYGYNRFSGQRYMSCMFDEGYGRVKPCDSGGDGGGGRN